MEMRIRLYVIIIGDLIQGFDVIGPFQSKELADAYGEHYLGSAPWLIMECMQPAHVEGLLQ